jgi:hypothetical protein
MIKGKVKNTHGTVGKSSQIKSGDRTERPSKFLCKGFPLLWFGIAVLLIFGRSISFNYTYLDDHNLVLSNMDNLKSPAYIGKAFTEDVFHFPSVGTYYYRPVMTLSFMADAMTGNGSFSMFHFSNILYHWIATFLLFIFFIEVGFDRIKSFLFAMLFLVHPMVTQAVAWVPGRNDTLLAVFILGSFIFWLKHLNSPNNRNVVFHLLFYSLALLTKENAIVLPFLIILYSTVVLHTPLKKYIIAGTGWVIITLVWVIARYQVLGGAYSVPFSTQILSIVKSLPAVLPFLGKVFFPFDLSVFPILRDMKVSFILGALAIGLLLLLVWVTKPKQWFYFFFGIVWFLAFLVPSFVSIGPQIPNFSEHRSYLSLVGILFFIMVCNPVNKADFSRLIPVSLLAGLCLFFSILTFLHSRHFKDQFAFWQNAVDTSPSNAFNYKNLGGMYFMSEDLVKAEGYFRKALQVNPSEPIANSDLGLVCAYTGRPSEAEKYYLEEIRINPTYDHVYYILGLLYYSQSRDAEAVHQWEKLLTINSTHADAYKALLDAYEKLGRTKDYQRIALMAKENGLFAN